MAFLRPQNGFYAALGTPLDENGYYIEEGMFTQLDMIINAGASGMLLMGSMGIEPQIRNDDYAKMVYSVSNHVNKRVPLFVGAMDNSIGRVLDRINSITEAKIDGIVLTTPYYFTSVTSALIRFFTSIADSSPFPIYLYDLPVATKIKITMPMVKILSQHPNIAGIKTGDLVLARNLKDNPDIKEDFSVLFSGLDIFDVANSYGVARNLDGMFSCTPQNAKCMYEAIASGNMKQAKLCLDNIVALRDVMAANDIFPAFTAAMNALGCKGSFAPDYEGLPSAAAIECVKAEMHRIGEI